VTAGEGLLVARVGHLGGRANEVLTAREREVVKLIAEAHTNRQIAEVLHFSEAVESHRGDVLCKLGRRDRAETCATRYPRGCSSHRVSAAWPGT
jgi:DNA-binding NarL/FixJ family response regulator